MTLYSKHPVTNVAIPLYATLENAFSKESNSMFRIILVESGTGILKVNNRSFVFMAPSVFCLNERDAIELVKACDIKAQVIYFEPGIIDSSFDIDKIYNKTFFERFTSIQDYFYLEPFINRSDNACPYVELGFSTFKRMQELYTKLYEEINPCKGDYWVCRSRSFFLEILFLIQYIYTDFKQDNIIQLSNDCNALNEVILYLHTNYQNKVTIEELTKFFHMNRTTLAERFRALTGMSIKEYLIKLRIKLAAVMLRDTMLPLSEIMCRAGFNEANYFSRTFKRHMNCSPSDYRRKFNT